MSSRPPHRSGELARSLRRAFSGVRARLFAYATLILVLGVGVTLFTTREILIRQMDSRIERQLTQEVQEFRNLAGAINPADGKPFAGRLRPLFTTFMQRNVLASSEQVITLLAGRPFLAKSASDPSSPANAADRVAELDPGETRRWRSLQTGRFGNVRGPAGEYRYLAVPVKANDETRGAFVVLHRLDPDRDEVADTVRIAGLLGLVALAVGAIVAYLGAGRVLLPLRELTETARSIEETDLTRRINVKGDDELSELGRTFNGMLDRLEGAFSSQRELIRSVNHELRTPLTIVRGHLELLDDDPETRAETIDLVTDELDRMALIVDDLLTLARAERDDFVVPQAVAIHHLLDEILTKATALGSRQWRLDVQDDPGSAEVDPQRITQAMLNLIDNAVRQTDEGQVVSIGASRDGGILLWVEDEGPGVSEEDADRIFDRFQRGRQGRRYSGSGLGLAIVRAIAEGHDGEAGVGRSELGGARFWIALPETGQPGWAEEADDDETMEMER